MKQVSEKRKEYLRNYRMSHRAEIREKYRVYNREYARKRRGARFPKGSTVAKGRHYEIEALRMLPNSKDNNKFCFAGSWDIEWKNKKIDVKMREKYKNGWQFVNLNNHADIDFYLLFCVEAGQTKKILLMPSNLCKKSVYIADNSDRDHFSISGQLES